MGLANGIRIIPKRSGFHCIKIKKKKKRKESEREIEQGIVFVSLEIVPGGARLVS